LKHSSTIAVLDPEGGLGRSVARMFTRRGCRAETVTEPEKILDWLASENRPDVVVAIEPQDPSEHPRFHAAQLAASAQCAGDHTPFVLLLSGIGNRAIERTLNRLDAVSLAPPFLPEQVLRAVLLLLGPMANELKDLPAIVSV
jgi:DNA-binding NtrC family response regulator